MILDRLTRAAIWLAVLFYVAAFFFLLTRRVPHPGELDFIEGAVLDHVARLAQGQPIFVEPTVDFVPLAYMPGFAFFSSLLARVLGAELWVPRLVSAGSMTLLAALVGWVLLRETRSRTLAVAGPGILLASFGSSGGHFDIARPDSLMLLLALVGMALLRFTEGWRGAVAAGVVLTLSFFTKQHAVWFAFAGLGYLLFGDRRRLVPFGATVLVGFVGGFFLLSAWLGPWFTFFTWDEPSHWSQIDRGRIVDYLGYKLLGRYGLLSAATFLALAVPGGLGRGRGGLWAWVALAGLATGLMATLDPHAFSHVINPTVVTLSVLGPLAVHHLLQHYGSMPENRLGHRTALVLMLLLGQFVVLYYGIRGFIPDARAGEARAELEALIASYPGPVMVTYHGHYARSAGKGTSLQMIAFDDIVRAEGNSLLERDPEFIDRMMEPLRSGPQRPVIISDAELVESGDQTNPWWREVAPGYVLLGGLGWIGEALTPVVGHPTAPRYVYVPEERAGEFTSEGLPVAGEVQAQPQGEER